MVNVSWTGTVWTHLGDLCDVSFFNELFRSSLPVPTQYGYLGETFGDSDSTDAAVLRAHDETQTPTASTGARPKRKGSCTAIIGKK